MARKPISKQSLPNTQPVPNGAMPFQPGPGIGLGNIKIKAGPKSSPPGPTAVRGTTPPKMSAPKPPKVAVRQPRKTSFKGR